MTIDKKDLKHVLFNPDVFEERIPVPSVESWVLAGRINKVARELNKVMGKTEFPLPETWPPIVTNSVFDAINYLERQYETPLGPYARRIVDMIQAVRRREDSEFSKLDTTGGDLRIELKVTVPTVAKNVEVTLTL